ncbi:MAG TPA: hypothetical protein VMQ58_01570 [Candidatus Saccharimonadales bacterium]|jgi:hypothetical protein|nr:hypothetical protein [Candidatus Saccharimonadales bacterium]
MENRRLKKDLLNGLLVGTLGTLTLFGAARFIDSTQSQNSETNEAVAGLPNFHGKSAEKFISESKATKEELEKGTLVKISVDDIPLGDNSLRQPSTIDNIAWDITPKGGDVNQVASQLQNLQNPNANSGVVIPGQEFVVNVTPGSVQLAKDEAKQGIY